MINFKIIAVHDNRHKFLLLMICRTKTLAIIIRNYYIYMKHEVQIIERFILNIMLLYVLSSLLYVLNVLTSFQGE